LHLTVAKSISFNPYFTINAIDTDEATCMLKNAKGPTHWHGR